MSPRIFNSLLVFWQEEAFQASLVHFLTQTSNHFSQGAQIPFNGEGKGGEMVPRGHNQAQGHLLLSHWLFFLVLFSGENAPALWLEAEFSISLSNGALLK